MRNLLMTPGPTPIPEEARLEMAKNIVHHRTSEYSEVFKELSKNLKTIFKTKNPVLTLTSSGSGGMEAAVCNLFSKGDKVVVINIGNFGERFKKLTNIYGLDVLEIKYEWGTSANPEDLKSVLEENFDVKGVFITHHETSTGVVNNIESFGKILKDKDILFIVDTISGLIANEFKPDEWGVDCAIAGSQKGFMSPPGLAFVSLSEMAIEACKKSDLPKFYFSFENHLSKLPDGQNPTTPAVSLIYSANVACKIIVEKGVDSLINHHYDLKEAVAQGVKALKLDFFVENEKDRGNTTTSIVSPEGIDGQAINKKMRTEHGITIAGGQAKVKGKIFRIGHLGDVDRLDVISTFSALEVVLDSLGYGSFKPGDSLAAIQKYYMSN